MWLVDGAGGRVAGGGLLRRRLAPSWCLSHRDHHLTSDLSRFKATHGVRRLVERVGPVDDGGQLAGAEVHSSKSKTPEDAGILRELMGAGFYALQRQSATL
jgi:hypothetical protein